MWSWIRIEELLCHDLETSDFKYNAAHSWPSPPTVQLRSSTLGLFVVDRFKCGTCAILDWSR